MIQFQKALPTDRILWAFNNNVIKYRDTAVANATHSILSTAHFSVTLYPDPNGYFTFNFKEYLKAIVAQDKFVDNLELSISNNISSLVYDATSLEYWNLEATLSVHSQVADGEETIKNYKFLRGVIQIEDYKRRETYQEGFFILANPNRGTNNNYKLNYWPGYPMDVSFLSSSGVMTVNNITNAISMNVTIPTNKKVTRLAFCDGSHDETIEDFLPLSFGLNRLRLSKHQLPSVDPIFINVEKHSPRCGIYVKYRTQLGGWGYWLFHQNHNRARNVKDGDELENDWNNLDETFAPTIQTGAESSQDTIKALAQRLTLEDVRALEYIIESPKVYLYVAERFSQGSQLSVDQVPLAKRWIEVKCMTRKLDIHQPKKHKYSFLMEFALPARYRVSLT